MGLGYKLLGYSPPLQYIARDISVKLICFVTVCLSVCLYVCVLMKNKYR